MGLVAVTVSTNCRPYSLDLVDGEGDGGVSYALDEELADVVGLDVAEVGISPVRGRGREVRPRPGQEAHVTSSTATRARATASGRMANNTSRRLTRSSWNAAMPASPALEAQGVLDAADVGE